MYYQMQSVTLVILLFFARNCQTSHSLTHGVDVYENIEQCSGNFSGPQCDIPYVICEDGETKCFNNSQCKSTKNSNNVIEYYYCDCTYADKFVEESSGDTTKTRFAGLECEHSSTEMCDDVEDGFGSQFCTNGGSCMNYVTGGVTRGGCSCPTSPTKYVGAYCQYLGSSVQGGLEGESLFPDVNENFWALLPEKGSKRSKHKDSTSVAIGISVSCIAMITLGFGITLMKRKKLMKGHEKRISMDPSAIEADGSGTLNKGTEML